jgi:hypothetical protein
MFGKIRQAGSVQPTDVRYVTNPSSTSTGEAQNGVVPSEGEVVLVQCEKFRCLAFRDKHGKWRSPFSKMELNDVAFVIQADAN